MSVRSDKPFRHWTHKFYLDEIAQTTSQVMIEIIRQAEMVAYVDSFRVILALAVVMTPLCLLLRSSPRLSAAPTPIHAE